MRVSSVTTFLSVVALASVMAGAAEDQQSKDLLVKSFAQYEQAFTEWMHTFEMRFDNGLEHVRRLETFIANDLFISQHNQRRDKWGFELGHNAFSHLTFDEFKSQMIGGFQMPQEELARRLLKQNNSSRDDSNVPDSVDWVAKGGVTAVKNQGQCGSCWAFSTTGAVEGAAFASTGKLPNLSEQELVDCDNRVDHGCHGGFMDHAFSWIEKHNGLCSESSYPYHAKEETCHLCKPIVKVTGYADVDSNDEKALQVAVAKQPVAVAIEADQREFQFYRSGVFTKQCGTQLDHGVLVVGYGVDNGNKFWKIKNSWGPSWGEHGFIRISREMAGPEGQCGVAMAPSYPTAKFIDAEDEDEDGGDAQPALVDLQAKSHESKDVRVYEYSVLG